MCPASTRRTPPSTSFSSLEYPIPLVVPFCDEGTFTDDLACISPTQKERKASTSRPEILPSDVVHLDSKADQSSITPTTPSTSETHSPDSGFSSDDALYPSIQRERAKTLPSHSALRKSHHKSSCQSCKHVKFADSMGLDLTQQRCFERDEDSDDDLQAACCSTSPAPSPSTKLRATNFVYRPECEILAATREGMVTVAGLNPIEDGHVVGQVNVLNVAFEKKVLVQYSLDGWKSSTELPVVYSRSISDDIDVFNFIIAVPSESSTRCELCVSFEVNDNVYWDSNSGQNYVLQWMNTDEPPVVDNKKQSPLVAYSAYEEEKMRSIDCIISRSDLCTRRGRSRWLHTLKRITPENE